MLSSEKPSIDRPGARTEHGNRADEHREQQVNPLVARHPNFGNPINHLTSRQFGQWTQMLGTSLGCDGQNGGLNPLYQIGGPRSVQLALKLLF